MNKITENIYYVGVKDPDLKTFDIIMDTEFGSTYNSYIVKGEKIALIETAHDKFTDEYIKNIEEVVSVKDIDYVILNHTEPDHSGSLERILKMNPDITVVGTIAALRNLKEITNMTFKELLAKDGEELSLGDFSLKFIVAPNLHWPDTMMTYMEKDKALFSCDVLGAHYCFDGLFDTEIKNKADYEKAMKVYFDCIVAPFKPFVLKGIEKIKDLEIEMVLNSHGPLLKEYIGEGIKKYIGWSTPEITGLRKAAVCYVSAYGYTKMLAEAAYNTILEHDLFNVKLIDLEKERLCGEEYDIILFGTPTINRNALSPVWNALTGLDVISSANTKFGVFGSYGWSGEGAILLNNTLKALRLKTEDEPFRVLFKPTEKDLENMKEFTKGIISKL